MKKTWYKKIENPKSLRTFGFSEGIAQIGAERFFHILGNRCSNCSSSKIRRKVPKIKEQFSGRSELIVRSWTHLSHPYFFTLLY